MTRTYTEEGDAEARACDDSVDYVERSWPVPTIRAHENFGDAMERATLSQMANFEDGGTLKDLHDTVVEAIDHHGEVYAKACVAIATAVEVLDSDGEESPGHEIQLIYDEFLQRLDDVAVGLFDLKVAVEREMGKDHNWEDLEEEGEHEGEA